MGLSRAGLASGALLIAGVLLGAAVGEGILRLYAAAGGEVGRRLNEHDPLRVLIEPMGDLGYRQRPRSVMRYPNGAFASANSLGFRGPEVTREKPVGIVRVVLLGGSTTHGWWVNDRETIDAHMRVMLAQLAPFQRFEVINAALDGYDSYQLLERLRIDVLPLRPDIVIINSGINDVRNARFTEIADGDSRTLLWGNVLERLRREQVEGPSIWSLAKHHSLLLRLPGFLNLLLASPSDRANDQISQGEGESTVFFTPDAADYFERNLVRIAETARVAGIKLIFSTPPSSLTQGYRSTSGLRVNYIIGDNATTQAYRDTLAGRMQRVAAAHSSGGFFIPYLAPTVPLADFLDDAHLSTTGNRIVAEAFTRAVLRSTGGSESPR